MSHLANGHNLPGLGDLTVLRPGESLAGSIRLQPQEIG
jgi:aldose 1-epimerase